MTSLDTLISRIGYTFADTRLLEGALTHRARTNEHPELTHQLADGERMEFLGDSILNYIAADLIYVHFPTQNEGELTNIRSALIKTPTLATFARTLNLGRYLRVNKSEEHSGARDRDTLLADTFEALLAAIYLDGGLEAARTFVTPFLASQIASIALHGLALDYKSQLMRRVQAARNITPLYRVVAVSGPEHRPEFTVEVWAGDELLAQGHGIGKQAATQDAARAALEKLSRIQEPGARRHEAGAKGQGV